jgi:ABC-type Fe3+ transport system permease subunit
MNSDILPGPAGTSLMFRGPQFETVATKIFHLVFKHGKLRARTNATVVFSMFMFLCEKGMSASQQQGESSQKRLGYSEVLSDR